MSETIRSGTAKFEATKAVNVETNIHPGEELNQNLDDLEELAHELANRSESLHIKLLGYFPEDPNTKEPFVAREGIIPCTSDRITTVRRRLRTAATRFSQIHDAL